MAMTKITKIADVDPELVVGFSGVVAYLSRSGHPLVTKEFKEWMVSRQCGECGYCGEIMDRPTMEHIQPRIKKGRYLPPNLMMVCAYCNSQKKDRHYSFMRSAIQLKQAGLTGIISIAQMTTLVEMGANLNLPDEKPLRFESSDWPHVKPFSIGG